MTRDPGISGRRVILGGLAAAFLFLCWWIPVHRAEPLLPTADLYTHLSVARHLTAGEGFQTDITYPLSFAFPFARELPQPLIHRGPGYGLLMLLPYQAAGRDPADTITAVRWLQILILGLIVLTGAVGHLRRMQVISLAPWLVLMGANPLLVYAVDWGFEELLAGWLVLMIWLRTREGRLPGLPEGILAGMLTVLRLDLFWVPVLWWIWFTRERHLLPLANEAGKPTRPWRGILVAMTVLILFQAPWAVRNLRLTGQPFFSLQGQAELVKDTSTWPGYSVYQQLTPQPVATALAADPGPILRKVARGLKFYTLHLPRLLPLPFLLLGTVLVFVLLRGKITHLPCPFRRGREHPMSILAEDTPLGPLAAAAFTTGLLAIQYSFFDHSLRHLLVILPVMAWEFSPVTGDLAARFLARRIPSWPSRPRAAVVMTASGLITLAVIWLSWSPLEGWNQARTQARSAAPHLDERVAAFARAEGPVIFVADASVTWYGNRPAVWDPGQGEIREKIREYLADR